MEKKLLNDQIIQEIKQKIPPKTQLSSFLSELLLIEKEAVYRRLRGEVPFTFAEVSTISQKLDLSIDNIIGTNSSKSRPFQLKLIDFVNSQEIDYAMLEHYIEILTNLRDDPTYETAYYSNCLPEPLYYKYKKITQFYIFKWYNQYHGGDYLKPMGKLEVSDRLKKLQQERMRESKYAKKTFYIWDNLIFQYLVNDIKYFHSIHLISTNEVQDLKDELLRFIDETEILATRGQYPETGNEVNFFISSINFDTSYSYVYTDQLQITLIHSFILNAIASIDKKTFERLKNWAHSSRRTSVMISGTGEKHRILFFKRQREIIQTL